MSGARGATTAGVDSTVPQASMDLDSDDVVFEFDNVEGGKDERVFKKAKRTAKAVDGETDPEGVSNGVILATTHSNNNIDKSVQLKNSRNSRKSRNAVGRGLPKKGGAGGKGTWGKPGSEQGVEGQAVDSKDPNYDSDTQDEYEVRVLAPELTDDDFEKTLKPTLLEYLENGDPGEVLEALDELNVHKKRHKIVCSAIALALERHDPHRELMSRLVSDLYGEVLEMDDVTKGFDELLTNLKDLCLDTPDAPALLGQFIARAVADDCLPPKYVTSYDGKMDCDLGRLALDKAEVLLNMKHGLVRLDSVWGTGGGLRPVKSLKKRMFLLLQEYLSSGDVNEAVRCIRELDVPHFHHEIVYEGVIMAVEDGKPLSLDSMVKLVAYLFKTNIVTPSCMDQGIDRVFRELPELTVDVPNAYDLIDTIGTKLHDAGALSDRLYNDLPSRGRKRFVSEGDGGILKPKQE